MMTMTTMTTSEIAAELNTTPRELRKFLRATQEKDTLPGKGGRYALPGNKREINKLRKQFDGWKAETEAARKARDEKKVSDNVADTEIDDTELEAEDLTVDED